MAGTRCIRPSIGSCPPDNEDRFCYACYPASSTYSPDGPLPGAGRYQWDGCGNGFCPDEPILYSQTNQPLAHTDALVEIEGFVDTSCTPQCPPYSRLVCGCCTNNARLIQFGSTAERGKLADALIGAYDGFIASTCYGLASSGTGGVAGFYVFSPEETAEIVAEDTIFEACNFIGACCKADGSCRNTDACSCDDPGDVWHRNKTCSEVNCGNACCGCTWCCNISEEACDDAKGLAYVAGGQCDGACDLPRNPPCLHADFVVTPQTRLATGAFRLRSADSSEFSDTDGCGYQQADLLAQSVAGHAPTFAAHTCGHFDRTRRTQTYRGYTGGVVRQPDGTFAFVVNYHKRCPPKPC